MSTDVAATIAAKASQAAKAVANLTTEQKNFVLQSMANHIRNASAAILEANKDEVATASANGTSAAMLDRLTLTTDRIESMAKAIEQIIALADPVGATRQIEQRPNGINIEKRRIALGVICMIYEARPNVTADAGALCFKSGNAVILRCGREAIQTSLAIAAAMQQALREHKLPDEVISIVPDPDRDLMLALLKQDQYIDLVIPQFNLRGGMYDVTFQLSLGSTRTEDFIDVLEKAISIDVLPGDIWKSGKLNRLGNYAILHSNFEN